MGSEAEMLNSLSGVLWSSEEKGVASGWGSEGQLIDGQSFTAGSKDASTGSGSETESRNTELGNLQQSVVIGDGTNNDDGSLLLLASVCNESRDGNWWSVDAGHEQSAEDDLVERRVGTAWRKKSQL